MAEGLSGIVKALKKILAKNGSTFDESLEPEITRILERDIDPSHMNQEDNLLFCNATRDTNLVHRDREYARTIKIKEKELKDTLIVGTLTASIGEQIARQRISELINYLEDNSLKITGQDISFKGLIYPEDQIKWKFIGCNEKPDETDLTLEGRVGNDAVIEIVTKISDSYKPMPQVAGPIYSLRGKDLKLTSKDLFDFYQAKRETDPGQGLPQMFVISLVPATLVHMLEAKTGKREGFNMKMNVQYLNNASREDLTNTQIDIFPPRRSPKISQEQFVYRLAAIASQNTKPINYVEMMCATRSLIEF